MEITTLIPAYKSKYILELLTAIKQQTVKPKRIIISDDNPSLEITRLLSSDEVKPVLNELKIEIVKGPQMGAYNNIRYLMYLHNSNTELFHILFDDDIPYPNFYEKHIQAHSITQLYSVVSRRWTALESGQPLRDLPVPIEINNHQNKFLSLNNELIFERTVGLSMNWLGEFSNATFRSEMINELESPSLDNICYTGLEDLGSFLKASIKTPVGFINEHLGFFRTSPNQNSANPMGRPLKLAFLAYIALAIASRRLGYLNLVQYKSVIDTVIPFINFHYANESDMIEICTKINALFNGELNSESDFLKSWDIFSGASTHQSMSEIIYCAETINI